MSPVSREQPSDSLLPARLLWGRRTWTTRGWQRSAPCAGVQLASNGASCSAPTPQPHPEKTPQNSSYNAIHSKNAQK